MWGFTSSPVFFFFFHNIHFYIPPPADRLKECDWLDKLHTWPEKVFAFKLLKFDSWAFLGNLPAHFFLFLKIFNTSPPFPDPCLPPSPHLRFLQVDSVCAQILRPIAGFHLHWPRGAASGQVVAHQAPARRRLLPGRGADSEQRPAGRWIAAVKVHRVQSSSNYEAGRNRNDTLFF